MAGCDGCDCVAIVCRVADGLGWSSLDWIRLTGFGFYDLGRC